MDNASHLGGNCGQRLSAEIRTAAVSGNVALELVSEAILTLTNGDLSGNPQAASQTRVSKLRKPGLSAILTRLLGREVKTAELQELPVMAEAAQVTSLCDDSQGNDRANAWYAPERLSRWRIRPRASAMTILNILTAGESRGSGSPTEVRAVS